MLKNAIDYLYAEWNNKAAAFVSYGSVGGARAVEHLRAICSELQIAHVRQQLSFSMFTDFENFSTFRPVAAIHDDAATVMFDQLEAWTAALKPLRKKPRDEKKLEEKIALVAGAAPGNIGAATAVRLAEEGTAVVVADLNESAARAVAEP